MEQDVTETAWSKARALTPASRLSHEHAKESLVLNRMNGTVGEVSEVQTDWQGTFIALEVNTDSSQMTGAQQIRVKI